MAVRVESVRGKSGFFRAGDEIISIGSSRVGDQLDLHFLTTTEGKVLFKVRRSDGKLASRRLAIRRFEEAGLVLESMKFKACRSHCIFCFVDQMPPGLRESLYFKDDDYRLSFLYGNYTTLNDVSEKDLRRIIAMRLSPLYISIHAIDRGTRERLFGRPMRRGIKSLVERFSRAGITMHVQVVLVPGVNDGNILWDTVRELFRFYPACRSVALVPVGLTGHRDGLARVRGVSALDARRTIDWAVERRAVFRKETGGEHFLHLADEFYLLSGRVLPPENAYDDFAQLANGVGMCRLFLKALEKDSIALKRRGLAKSEMTVVTGSLGARFLARYALPLLSDTLPGIRIDVLKVTNRLFGPAVGVSGLLAGADIASAVRRSGRIAGCLVIPPNALNHEGLLIDDMRPRDLAKELGVGVLVPRTTFLEAGIVRRCRKDRGR